MSNLSLLLDEKIGTTAAVVPILRSEKLFKADNKPMVQLAIFETAMNGPIQ
ncbi:hypothetical protein [Paenibacillus massiliensis]|uniref:hypothetical protein n=1 Tax=Paenibacillus massiliensis TaxID=225917 RepID=UPI001E5820D5|nr:hypothetical protein [Paenibacillus massiliensis]